MISGKKSYAEQLLHLAITLSLLRVDPDNYLGWGWESQLALQNGDGWQLELRAAPLSDYPYANQKVMVPLIEDLIRFDRYTQPSDYQTYLLNVHDDPSNGERLDDPTNRTTTETNHQSSVDLIRNPSAHQPPNELDLFLHSDHFSRPESIFDQTQSDLNDFPPLTDHTFAAFKPTDPTVDIVDLMIRSQRAGSSRTIRPTTGTCDPFLIGGRTEVRWTPTDEPPVNRTGWMTYFERDGDVNRTVDDDGRESNGKGEETSGISSGCELSDEDSEIIEVLWKQDVDLGYTLTPPSLKDAAKNQQDSKNNTINEDEIEKLQALQDLKKDEKRDAADKSDELTDEWAGINFTIDNETGEYIQLPLQLDDLLQDVLQLADLTDADSDLSNENLLSNKDEFDLIFNETILQEDATATGTPSPVSTSKQSETGDDQSIESKSNKGTSDSSTSSDIDESDDPLKEFDMMIQSTGPFQHPRASQSYGHHHHHFHHGGGAGGSSGIGGTPSMSSASSNLSYHRQASYHQPRVSLSRAVSMEQRLQDIASLFNPLPGMSVSMGVGEMASYPYYPSHHSYHQAVGPVPQHSQFAHSHAAVLHHNASLAEIGAPSQPHYGPNLGTAVSSSMHLTNSSHHDSDASYKIDHDMMYYSNSSNELNHTTDGFINSILNDEDLQLMDMAASEGFYTMRMLEPNATSNNSSLLSSSNATQLSNVLGASMAPTSTNLNIGHLSGGTTIPQSSAGDRLDASSDSAVSSMGSERVPSLSDSEWGDAGSDSAQEFHHQRNSSKYGSPYDYSYSRIGDSSRHPVAQKKHQMFGKQRFFPDQSPTVPALSQLPDTQTNATINEPPSVKYEYDHSPYGIHNASSITNSHLDGAIGPLINKHSAQMSVTPPEIKYSCSLDFARQPTRTVHDMIQHNHTYTLPQTSGATPRPQTRDKKMVKKLTEDEHLTRDEKRARSLNIPMLVHDIINLPMDEFNERLSKYDLSETQLSLIRDIRRRGKNKVAAQNCRKRKLDQIICLADEVKEVRKRKERLFQERDMAVAERKRIMNKFSALYRHIFQNLRDSDGNPYSPSQYSLQQSSDGSIFLLPRDTKDGNTNGNGTTNSTATAMNPIQNGHQYSSNSDNVLTHMSHAHLQQHNLQQQNSTGHHSNLLNHQQHPHLHNKD